MFTLKTNEGNLDRAIRIVLGISGIVYSTVYLSGNIQTVVSLIGIAVLFTGLVGFCGLYALFGINTCPIKVKTKTVKPSKKVSGVKKNSRK